MWWSGLERARRAFVRSLFALHLQALAIIGSAPVLAQEGWEDLEPATTTPAAPAASTLGPLSAGLEAGRPLVFGIEAGYNFSALTSANLGFAALGDFSAISGEMRFYPLGLSTEQGIFSAGAGFTQYFLAEGGDETSPIAAHVLAGLEYIFPSKLGVGGSVGYQLALGNSENREVRRYGVHDDLAEWFFSVNARYFF